jgi:hypothetical protein
VSGAAQAATDVANSFVFPAFEWGAVLFVAAGSALLWGKLGYEGRKVYVLDDLLVSIGLPRYICTPLGFAIFIAIGCVVAIGTVDPKTPMQAIVAGMGWTGMLSSAATKIDPVAGERGR